MENSSYTNGKLTRDLQDCSAVPQPTALRRAPLTLMVSVFLNFINKIQQSKSQTFHPIMVAFVTSLEKLLIIIIRMSLEHPSSLLTSELLLK